jgi:mycothiol synthase
MPPVDATERTREGRAVSVRPSRADDLPEIEAVMLASLEADAIPGFTRFDLSRAIVRIPADYDGTLVALDGEAVVGYCTPRHDDLTVRPECRRRGHGRRLVAAARELAGRRGDATLVLYVPSHLDASRRFAEALGFSYASSLWLFRLPGDRPVGAPEFPADVVTRSWGPDEDLPAYVTFANASFEGHPTPLGLNKELARHVAGLPGFDPGGILLVSRSAEPERLVAFTKVELMPEPPGPPTGYIAQIGVLPEWRGRGLGRALLRWGVAYTRSRGATTVELSVEARNETATRLYRSEGFSPAIEWPHWSLST